MTTLKIVGVAVVVIASLTGCPGGRSSRTRTDGGPGGGCPNIAGDWTITDHCEASAVGGGLVVTQTGCAIESSGTFPAGWGGSVDAAGGITMTGPIGEGMTLTCVGSVTGESINMTCTPGGCVVGLSRGAP